jgi:chromate transporter
MAIPTHPVSEVAGVFLRLGVTAFGGPVAHIAAMEDECVVRRGWISRSEFADLLSAANVIPGPNSTELAIHLGYVRAGWRGLLAAGMAFILPSTAIVWVLAMAYARFGQRPEIAALLRGMQPVVLAVVVQAVWRLLRSTMRTPLLICVAVASAVAVLAGVHELVVLVGAATIGAVAWRGSRVDHVAAGAVLMAPRPGTLSTLFAGVALGSATVSASSLFLAFLKIGSTIFGSGYVLLAMLRGEFVQRHAWLTETQLLDAIAIGQVTPGPVFSSATFIGYLLAGHAGAAGATLGIFLPAFLFVAVSGPLLRQMRAHPRASAALDAVNAASIALMVAVVALLAKPVATSALSVGIFLVSMLVLLRTSIGASWMLLAGALCGIIQAWVH